MHYLCLSPLPSLRLYKRNSFCFSLHRLRAQPLNSSLLFLHLFVVLIFLLFCIILSSPLQRYFFFNPLHVSIHPSPNSLQFLLGVAPTPPLYATIHANPNKTFPTPISCSVASSAFIPKPRAQQYDQEIILNNA